MSPRYSKDQLALFKGTIESCLECGFRPVGMVGHGALDESSQRLGVTVSDLQNLIRLGKLTVDWSRYKAKPKEVDPDAEIRVLVIPDAHDCPDLSKERFGWMGEHAASGGFDRIVFIGDIADLDSVTAHVPNDSLAGKLKPSFLSDMASLNEAVETFMAPFNGALPEIDLTLGNHEYRMYRFEDGAPETAGMLQHEFDRVMEANGIRTHEFGAYLDIGGVLFTHIPINGYGKPMGGMYTTQSVGRQSTQDVVFGHSHRASVSTAPKVANQSVRIFEVGCALPPGHRKSYARHNLGAWDYVVVELTISRSKVIGWSYLPMEQLQKIYGRTR